MADAIWVRDASLFGQQQICWACGAHFFDYHCTSARCPDCGQLAGLDTLIRPPPDEARLFEDPYDATPPELYPLVPENRVRVSEFIGDSGWHIEAA